MAVDFVLSIGAKVAEYLVEPIALQFGYVVFYKSNLDKLREEVNKLEEEVVHCNYQLMQHEEMDGLLDPMLRGGWKGKATKKTAEVAKLHGEGNFATVSYPAPPPGIESESTKGIKSFESRRRIINEVMQALKDNRFHMIGICEMGGVGKTTMVKEVAKRVKKEILSGVGGAGKTPMVKEVTKSVNKEQLFDEVVIAVVSQSPDEKKIQAEIADKLGLKFEEESVSRRADRLRESLPSKRILVILDDVWKRLELIDIGIPYREGHSGCKILLTSRFVYICDDMGVEEKFIVEALDKEEAWNLFKETAGISNDTSTEFYATQKVVADECGGLFVAIKTVARALKEDFDIPIEDLVRYGIGLESFEDIATVGETRQKVHDFVDDLKKCYLLMDSEEEEYVKMHNVIRDVAISIASGEEHSFMVGYDKALEDWPQHRLKNYVVISLKLNGMHGLPGNLEFRKLQLLKLDCNADLDNGMEEVQVQETPDCFCQGMKELRVLALSNLYGSLLTSLRCLTNL
ncbi:hypothetical protein TEA_024693 [Camellia sinensis var. sinensis]|uniref:NB-ARC domain-containing protein n=1 Tax=Camellia sinensis var. sinensis TaxID=542762 RepID=A0A4S4D6U1_CAMSN|nr:hypothetical protein TEA_024693 [Camellia sinensis var. sinensis]